MNNARIYAEDRERGGHRLAVDWAETELFQVLPRVAGRSSRARAGSKKGFLVFGSDLTPPAAYGRT